jgi:hypothetical protein
MATRKKTRPRKPPVPGDARRAVLVVGPPRSGTSVIAHMLSKLGVCFGEETDFVDPAVHAHNPIFFELKRLNELNERVLRELGYEYGDFDFFPAPDQAWDVFSEGLLADVTRLLREQLGDRRLIGLKDPRFCFTLPFWARVLAEHGYATNFVWALRSSGAATRSNELVNQLHAASYSARVTMLSLGASAMHLKALDPRIDVDYDDLVQSPVETAERLARFLGVGKNCIAEAAGVVDVNLRHQTASKVKLPDPAEELLLAGNEYRDFRVKLKEWGILELMDARRLEISRLQLELKNKDARVNELISVVDSLSANKNEKIIETFQAAINPMQVQVDYFGQLLKKQISATLRAERQLRTEIRRLNADLADCQQKSGEQISELSTEIEAAHSKLHDAAVKLQGRDSEIMSLKARLEEAEGTVGTYEERASRLTAEIEAAQLKLQNLAENHDLERQRLVSEANALRGEMNEREKASALRVASLEEEINRAHQVINNYKLAQGKLSSEVDRLNNELQECKVDLEISIRHRKNFERRLADLYQKMQDLEQDRAGK